MAFRPMDVCSSPHFAIHYLYDNRSTINNRNILMAMVLLLYARHFTYDALFLKNLMKWEKKLSQRELM